MSAVRYDPYMGR